MSKSSDILNDVYSRLPRINCQGKCFECCGPLVLHQEERKRMERRAGRGLVFLAESGRCSMLNDQNRCDVYKDRPMVCRLWGTVPEMKCPFGCEPERMLTTLEGKILTARLFVELGVNGATSSYPDDWTEYEVRHRWAMKRTLQYGPIHVPMHAESLAKGQAAWDKLKGDKDAG